MALEVYYNQNNIEMTNITPKSWIDIEEEFMTPTY
jgi:hypothetical protein